MKPINELFEQALAAHKADDLVTAKEFYLAVLAREPQHAQTLHMLGLLAAQLGQFKNAVIWFEEALRYQQNDPILHNNIANAFKQLSQWDKAQQHYQLAIELDDTYCDAYNNLGALFYKQNLMAEAEQYFQKAIALQPNYLEAHSNLGLLYIRQDNKNGAITQFEEVLKLQPNTAVAHWQLANLYLQLDELTKAEHHYQRLLGFQPRHIDALNNLGVLYLKKNNLEEAVNYFNKVLNIDPKYKDARNNLAGALLQQDRFTEAIWHYQLYLQLAPEDYQTHYTLGVAYMAAGYLLESIQQFKKILEIDPKHADAYCNLGALYLKLGKPTAAIENYQRVLQLQPDNKAADYMLNALTGKANPAAAPTEYIKNLFDSYAGHFDQHLTENLHYQVPLLMRQALIEHIPENAQWRILDLGCGSGLSGQELKDIAVHLVGVDISPRMLAKAREKNIYNELLEADILNALRDVKANYDLIVAADTLVYFGDLKPVFASVQAALHDKGLFAFTIETGAVRSYQLTDTARYQHAKIYIEMLAKHFDFQIIVDKKITGRLQQGEPVESNLFVLKK